MSYADRVQRVSDHVRAHLDGDLSLDALARVACFSPHHFHRVFRATTGETLTRFTQRCRLERAAYLMMASPERPLQSIAIEVGFSEQSDFSRVFRRHYGIAPSAWDRRCRLQPAVHDDYEEVVARARATGPEPVACVRTYPACRVAYLRMGNFFQGDVLAQGYAQLTALLEARGVDWRRAKLLGMSWDNYETTPIEQVRFDLGFTVDDHISPEGPLGIHVFPAVQAVDVHCKGPLVRVAVVWDFLYDEWLPRSRYEPADLPGIKRFRTRPDEIGWTEWDVDCSIAIRPMLG